MITLIGSKLAVPGKEFIYRGKATECKDCKLKNSCVNLEEGRRYRIESVRENILHECSLHEGGVVPVEISQPPISAAVDSRKAFEGSRIHFDPRCEQKTCEYRELCFPEGLKKGDRCIISKVGDFPGRCLLKKDLKIAELKRR